VASGLLQLGVEPGDRVALVGPNVASWVVAQWGIAAAGAIAVPLYATATPGQCQQLVADSGARCLIRHASLPEVTLPVPVLTMGQWEDLAVSPEIARRTDAVVLDDLAMIVYTSGTTARPKGVTLTWRNLAAVQQGVLGRYPRFAEPGAWRVVSHLPLNHVAEQLFTCILGIGLGGEVHLCPKMDALFEMLRAVRPTFFMGVPRQWEKLDAMAGSLEELGLDALHTAASGSAPLLARFAARGLPIEATA
jgi:long-chain acyl-CoA synthetase